IWEDPGHRSSMALLRDGDDRLLGVIVAAKATDLLGQVRAKLERRGARCVTGTMWSDDASEHGVTIDLRGPDRQLLTASGLGAWIRVYPPPTKPVSAERITELLGAPLCTAKR